MNKLYSIELPTGVAGIHTIVDVGGEIQNLILDGNIDDLDICRILKNLDAKGAYLKILTKNVGCYMANLNASDFEAKNIRVGRIPVRSGNEICDWLEEFEEVTEERLELLKWSGVSNIYELNANEDIQAKLDPIIVLITQADRIFSQVSHRNQDELLGKILEHADTAGISFILCTDRIYRLSNVLHTELKKWFSRITIATASQDSSSITVYTGDKEYHATTNPRFSIARYPDLSKVDKIIQTM